LRTNASSSITRTRAMSLALQPYNLCDVAMDDIALP
jgi:hypothetical protein